MARRYTIGDKVILTRSKSVRHFSGVGMTIRGEIAGIDPDHHEGRHRRPYLILFDDGRTGWYAAKEFKRLRKGVL